MTIVRVWPSTVFSLSFSSYSVQHAQIEQEFPWLWDNSQT